VTAKISKKTLVRGKPSEVGEHIYIPVFALFGYCATNEYISVH
jgi:hypothetical protein